MRKNNYNYKNQFLFRKYFFLSDGLGEQTRYEKLFFCSSYFFFSFFFFLLGFEKFACKTKSTVIPDYDKFLYSTLNQQSFWSIRKFFYFMNNQLSSKGVRNFFILWLYQQSLRNVGKKIGKIYYFLFLGLETRSLPGTPSIHYYLCLTC